MSAFTLSGIVCLSNNNGYTALHCAVEANKYKMIPLLLQADPLVANKVDKHGKTALHLGCKMNFSKCVESLLVSEYYLPITICTVCAACMVMCLMCWFNCSIMCTQMKSYFKENQTDEKTTSWC